MGHATKTAPALTELTAGRRFRKRPSLAMVEAFVRHVGRTGTPHTWAKITTTAPAKTSQPVLLKKFTIPDAFRRRGGARAPCPICCPFHPKYETGFLAWHPDDGLVRAIGQECGADYFEGGSFDDALAAYDREEAERGARAHLAVQYPNLVEQMVRAWFVRLELNERIRMRDEFAAKITKRAMDQLRRTVGPDGTLYVVVDTGQRDDRGRLIDAKKAIARIEGQEALVGGSKFLTKLCDAALAVGAHACVVLDERTERLGALSGHEAIQWEKHLRTFDQALESAARFNTELACLLTASNLIALAKYGADRDCPTPFWIKQIQNEVFAGKGIAPAKLLSRQNPARLNLPFQTV
jgi:hypothetical protein